MSQGKLLIVVISATLTAYALRTDTQSIVMDPAFARDLEGQMIYLTCSMHGIHAGRPRSFVGGISISDLARL